MFWMYAMFIALVLGLLALDLGVLNRKAHIIEPKEALGWSAFWISLGVAFSGVIYLAYEGHWMGLGLTPDRMSVPIEVEGVGLVYNDGRAALTKYITGFVVEKSLAVDNLFVIAMLFTFFGVPRLYQHRVLFWGILGALLMRGAMIGAGAALVHRFHWVLYIFGGILVYTGYKMAFSGDEGEKDFNDSKTMRLVRKLVPITQQYHGEHFFLKAGSPASKEAEVPGAAVERDEVLETAEPGSRLVTPLFVALVMVEITDLVFAVDSIPAIFSITTDAFIVFTSNVFAILGLRSLFFALAGLMAAFKYLKYALAVVLTFVGIKLLVHTHLKEWFGEHYDLWSLLIVGAVLTIGVVASILDNKRNGGGEGGEGKSAEA